MVIPTRHPSGRHRVMLHAHPMRNRTRERPEGAPTRAVIGMHVPLTPQQDGSDAPRGHAPDRTARPRPPSRASRRPSGGRPRSIRSGARGSSSSTRTGQFWSTLAFKPPLAHHETPAQQGFYAVWESPLLPDFYRCGCNNLGHWVTEARGACSGLDLDRHADLLGDGRPDVDIRIWRLDRDD